MYTCIKTLVSSHTSHWQIGFKLQCACQTSKETWEEIRLQSFWAWFDAQSWQHCFWCSSIADKCNISLVPMATWRRSLASSSHLLAGLNDMTGHVGALSVPSDSGCLVPVSPSDRLPIYLPTNHSTSLYPTLKSLMTSTSSTSAEKHTKSGSSSSQ